MCIVNTLSLESNRQIKINFDGGDLSSDAGLLLIKEFVSKLGIDKLLGKAFKTNDSALFWIWIPPSLMHTADRKVEPLTFIIKAMVIIRLSVMTE